MLGLHATTVRKIEHNLLPYKIVQIRGVRHASRNRAYRIADVMAYAQRPDRKMSKAGGMRTNFPGDLGELFRPARRPIDTHTPLSTLRSAIEWECEQAKRMFADQVVLKLVA